LDDDYKILEEATNILESVLSVGDVIKKALCSQWDRAMVEHGLTLAHFHPTSEGAGGAPPETKKNKTIKRYRKARTSEIWGRYVCHKISAVHRARGTLREAL
jgi:hypothetical protein